MKEKKTRISHAWEKLGDRTNFEEPVIAGFFGIGADIPLLQSALSQNIIVFKRMQNITSNLLLPPKVP